MRRITYLDELSIENLFPEKRRYFSIYYMGYNISLFEEFLKKSIPNNWPVNIFDSSVVASGRSIEFMHRASSMANAVVFWSSSNSECDFSSLPYLWCSQIGRHISSNKKFFGGSSAPCVFKAAADVVGGVEWYSDLGLLCNDLASAVSSELLEFVDINMNIDCRIRT